MFEINLSKNYKRAGTFIMSQFFCAFLEIKLFVIKEWKIYKNCHNYIK